MKDQRIVYLAIPYSWLPNLSFSAANLISAQLMTEGCIVFSPISHSHCIADFLPEELRTDSNWWMKQDLAMMKNCNEICIVNFKNHDGLKLIRDSYGVQKEMEYAKELKLKITYYNYE